MTYSSLFSMFEVRCEDVRPALVSSKLLLLRQWQRPAGLSGQRGERREERGVAGIYNYIYYLPAQLSAKCQHIIRLQTSVICYLSYYCCAGLIQFRLINNSINSKQVRNFLLLGRSIFYINSYKMSVKV